MRGLPGEFIERQLKVYGQAGRAWLEGFPSLRDDLRQFWSLTDPQPLSDLSYNYLEYARDPSGRQVVLKIGVPNPELEAEMQALKIYCGMSAVRLLDCDTSRGAMLLERIIPGHNLLEEQDDAEAIKIASLIMIDLWKPDPDSRVFPTVGKWCQGIQRYQARERERPGPLPLDQVQRAARLAKELLGDDISPTLLHGDLHQSNILRGGQNRWLAIDPKGLIGEKTCDVGPLLFNPIPDLMKQPDPRRVVSKRLDILEEMTGLDRSRMIAWSYVWAVLSSIWTVEERGESWDYGIEFARLLKEIH
jgi:streptomycin 6-kinase